MYGLIWLTDLKSKVSRMDLLVMLTSALCHDLDHPGYNNVFQVTSHAVRFASARLSTAHRLPCCCCCLYFSQINAQTDLALRYNDISPLENHHCAVAFGIMAQVPSAVHAAVDWEIHRFT